MRSNDVHFVQFEAPYLQCLPLIIYLFKFDKYLDWLLDHLELFSGGVSGGAGLSYWPFLGCACWKVRTMHSPEGCC